MPEITRLLKDRAGETGVRLDILEKDYALSYLLAAVAESPGLGERLVLKGGTALRKLYYRDYRFSEDLDFSTRSTGAISDLEQRLNEAIRHMNELLYERGPFQVQLEALRLKEPHPFDQAAFLVRVQFPSQRQPLCRLKVEVTVDEPVLVPTESRLILHDYNEPLTVAVQTYTLSEIVAEKLRALLQSQARLEARGWGASRVCRDYFDLWSILRRERLAVPIPELVERKCAVRNIEFKGPADFLAMPLQNIARAEWATQILPFVSNAPPSEQILSEVETLIRRLWE